MGCRANGTLLGKLTVDSAEAAAVSVLVATANQTSGRQRGDSSCPWGNSKNTRTGSRMVSSIGQTANQAAQSPPGSDPGAVTSAYWAYWLPAWVTATTRLKRHTASRSGCRVAGGDQGTDRRERHRHRDQVQLLVPRPAGPVAPIQPAS